jgi:serine/threonine protein kinase
MDLKTINPNGVHVREIKGLGELERSLPSHWFGYASFELIGHDGGEIDLLLCADDRLIIVEIKDWNIQITDNETKWVTPHFEVKSPVLVVADKARKLKERLQKFLVPNFAPFIDYCVLFTGTSRRSDLTERTKQKVFELEFFKNLGGTGTFRKCFPSEQRIHIEREFLKRELDRFFSISEGRVRSQRRAYNGYLAEEKARYVHPQKIFREYFAEIEGVKGTRALLRKWDFEELAKADPIYRASEHFKTIALREEDAIGYLNDKKPELADQYVFLQPISNEGRGSVTLNFFELYRLPNNLSRLKEALEKFKLGLKEDHRISLARLLLHHCAELHDLGVAHRDLGDHCIWIHVPDKVSISGFATSSFPEQKTVSQIRNTIRAGADRIPEELFQVESNNFRKDVYLLGSLVHQILLGEKPKLEENLPVWQTPNPPRFEPFWGWFKRALEWDPQERYEDGRVAFDEFQRCAKKPEPFNLCENDFREFKKAYLPMPGQSGDTILRHEERSIVFRRGDRLFKLWSEAKFSHGASANNVHLLNFLSRIQKLRQSKIPAQQEIIDFGVTSFGSYVELSWEEGRSLEEFDGSGFDDETCVRFVRSLVGVVADLHRCEVYHGDLTPGNILLLEGGRGSLNVRLIDLVDFAPLGSDRRTPAYLPPEGEDATTPGCDGYALRKIVVDFILPRMASVSADCKRRITAIMDKILDPNGGAPHLKGAFEDLETTLNSPEEIASEFREELAISMSGIPSELLMSPDDQGLPITVSSDRDASDCFVVRINDSTQCLALRYNRSQGKIEKAWIQQSALLDFTNSIRRQVASISRPIRILTSQTNDLSALQAALEEIAIFSDPENRFRTSQGNRPDDDFLVNSSGEDSGEIGIGDLTTKLGQPNPEPDLVDVPIDLLWNALLDAEEDIVPEVTVTAEPVEIKSSTAIVFAVSEPATPLDLQDEDSVGVYTQDSQGQWRFYGKLETRQSRNDQLFVTPKSKGGFQPVVGTVLRLQNKASRASYLKRLAATQRIMRRESVCSQLFDYFCCSDHPSVVSARFSSCLDRLDNYDLNLVQKEALKTALSTAPLSMIQGPPGTGKTSVISAAVHYIATNYPTARVLVVSQSHEAIDHATEQIVKRFRKQGHEPSLVRVGRRAAVSDNLISFHSESLQGEYRERYRLSLTQRILPVGKRLGLSDSFTENLTVYRARLIPLVKRLSQENEQSSLRHLENICRQLDRDFDFSRSPVSSVYDLMEERLIKQSAETDEKAINALRKVIDLALEWVETLEVAGKLDRFYVSSCQIVTGTCVGVGRWELGLERETFDCLIIDEAARCGPGDLAVASQVAHQVILVGDHKQLPPYLEKDVVELVSRKLSCRASIVERSDFQRLFDAPFSKVAGSTLGTQYRMREPIGRLVSECFYPEVGGIKAGRENSAACYDRLPVSISSHVTWIDSGKGEEERSSGGLSFINRSEIDLIIEILEEIDRDVQLVDELIDDANSLGLPASIGIIAAYKAQVEAIERRILESSLSGKLRQACKVGTVDSYQGKENPIVIFSAVRCNSHNDIGFTRSWERVNVSLSRARERLVIVGSWSFWEQSGCNAPLGKVVNYLAARFTEADAGYGRNF